MVGGGGVGAVVTNDWCIIICTNACFEQKYSLTKFSTTSLCTCEQRGAPD